MKSFRQLAELTTNVGSFGDTGWTGFDTQSFGQGHSLSLPEPTLEIPSKIISGIVSDLSYTTNPITFFVDNKQVKMTKEQWDYLKRMGKEIKEGLQAQIEYYLDGTIKAVDVH